MENEYDPENTESKWQKKWVENKSFAYQDEEKKEEVFSIDTPPPTVSGSLHMGHLYGQTLQDFMGRFQRMRGKNVFQPFGYDDNGIASERLTEKELGIKHQNYTRREFQEKCREICQKYEEEFTEKMQSLGIAHDWNSTYKTIEPRVQKISQLSFIDLYEKNREYREKAPAIWCPDCETAISQVEMEDAEKQSHFNDIEFPLASGHGSIMISTTRPELLPACVAIFVHPEDEANQNLVGEKAEVPLFNYEVPILEDERVDMETGSGVVMCCTFGDQTDIEWYKAHDLPLKLAIDESGTMTEEAGKYQGMSTQEARKAIIKDLKKNDKLLGQREITHTVQVHERCEEELEFLVKEQWYIELVDHKEKYLEAGRKMNWQPEKMFSRYKHWIEGLQWDWCISRQRDSGIPFPVWYCSECDHEIIAEKDWLPVDPLEDEPRTEECPECGNTEFKPEEDVLDTWATSSLTPLINADWDWNQEDGEYEMKLPEVYPMNLRPEGHDIISFWLFHTVVKCLEHTGEVPFDTVMNHGHVLDENREKMSKSKGNVVAPDEVLEKFPVDAARYWAAGSKVGDDFPFQEKDLKAGEKLMRKLWNASKLVDRLGNKNLPNIEEEELEEIDRWMLAETDQLIEEVTELMESYDFHKARDRLRHSFWNRFCDNYLEIAKQRLEDSEDLSAVYTLKKTHRKYLKMFAPFLSHITEEIWHQMYVPGSDSVDSIHNSDWPEKEEVEANLEKGEAAIQVITALRKYKTENQMAPTAPLEEVDVFADIESFKKPVKEVMHVENLNVKQEEPEIETKIKEIKLDYSKAGPKYGDDVSEIEDALENQEWALESGRLEAAGHMLPAEMYTVEKTREFKGSGEMIEQDDTVVIIR
ncbi:MAG: valine--tRNA ligase [Candidatus Nanohaloarchaea archaeon]